MADAEVPKFNNIRDTGLVKAPIYTGVKLIPGTYAMIDANGFAHRAADTAAMVSGGLVLRGTGPQGSCDNTDGASGDIDVVLQTEGITFVAAGSGYTPVDADFGDEVYFSDNNHVKKTATNYVVAGRVMEIDTVNGEAGVWIRQATPGNMDDISAVAALTDNSGGAAADGTIGAVTAPTAITNSSGSAASNGTIEAVTPPTAVTDSSAGTADGTLEALPNPTDTPATADALRDDLVAVHFPILRNWAAEFGARQAQNRTAIIALTDAIGEFATAQTANRTAIIALKDAVSELAAKVNEIINA